MKEKSYHQYCGLAYALDVVGERWTLLIIRELFAGPRRFTDLLEGLPGISTNLLSERLKSLEQRGLLCRRVLPPPAASMVYELTQLGRSLEKPLIELGKWGRQFVPESAEHETVLNLSSYALTLKTFFKPELAQDVNETCNLCVDQEVLQVQIKAGQLKVRQGESGSADAILYTQMPTYLQLLSGQMALEDALSEGLVRIEGDPQALKQLFKICAIPEINDTIQQN